MKNLILFCAMTIATLSHGQMQLSAGGSILKGTGYYNNHTQLMGGGMSAKYMIGEQFFLGATFREYHSSTTAYPEYFTQDHLRHYSASLDVVFRRGKKNQPYAGIHAGISETSHRIAYSRVFHSFGVISLKGGSYFGMSKSNSTGMFAHLLYNHTGSVGQPTVIDGIRNPVMTEPISNFLTLEVGYYIRLYLRMRVSKTKPK